MIITLRRIPFYTLLELMLLLTALSALVTGAGAKIGGAEASAFLPAVLPAVILGWLSGRTGLKTWQGLGALAVFGGLFLWSWTAQLGVPAFLLVYLSGVYLFQTFFALHGGPWVINPNTGVEMEAAIQELLTRSSNVWSRVAAWQEYLRAGKPVSDPMVNVLVWSLILWLAAAWAGWGVSRRKPLAGLIPALAVLAFITQYTNANIASLWLMAVSLLGLMSLTGFEDILRRWAARRVDFAELAISNTVFAAVGLTVMLASLGYMLPAISVKDILESMRRYNAAENQAAHSLGLEAPNLPAKTTPSGFSTQRTAALPNKHLLGSGPELSKDVVFTVQTGELPPLPFANVQTPAPRHYWRSYSFDIYTGAGWISSGVRSVQTPAGQPLFETPPGYRILKQKFKFVHGDEGSLYWSGTLNYSNLPFEAAWRSPPGQTIPAAVDPFRGVDLYGALNSAPVYQVESFIPQVSESALRAAGRDFPDFIQRRYSSLPSSVPERVRALARKLTSTAASPYDEALAIESYLRTNYPYSLDVPLPPAGADVVDYFLFDLKKGYCDYYATAMVVMARSVGIPARMVTGYASGTYDPQTAEYVVSAADAHSWVEIYFPGTGWVEFEPTASQPEINHSVPGNVPSNTGPAAVQNWDRFLRTVYRMPSVTRWVFAILAGMLVLSGLFFLLESWLLGLAPPGPAMRWMYRSIYRQGRHLSVRPVPGQTASEYSQELQGRLNKPDKRLDLLTGFYLNSLFSPHPLQKPDLRLAIKAWQGLRWKLIWTRKPKKPGAQ